MRLGVLDVGSNTVHLLVVDAHRGAEPTPQHSDKSELRLAEHIDKRGNLIDKGADALVRVVASARKQADSLHCDELLAFATSAVRDASNSEKVLVSVGNVPADAGTYFLRARLPAIASSGTIIRKRPLSIAIPSVRL